MKTCKAVVVFDPENSCFKVLKQEYISHVGWLTMSSLHFKYRRNARIYADLYEKGPHSQEVAND